MHLVGKLLKLDQRVPRHSKWDEFKIGFSDAAFKFQPRRSTTCYSEGHTYWRGTKETLLAMMEGKSMKGVDEFNFEDQSYTFLRKCNYADTIPGTIFNNAIVNYADKLEPESWKASLIYPISLASWMSDWYSVITSVMEISYSMEIFLDRMDMYNVGKLTGKFTKLVI